MNINIINVGVIEPNFQEEALFSSNLKKENNLHLTKCFVKNAANKELFQQYFPEAEIVDSINTIVNDRDISLVMLSSSMLGDKAIIEQVLQSGKSLRIL